MPQRILGIDLGAWSIKAMLVEDSFRGFQVLGAHEVRIAPGPPETRAERQAEALKSMVGPIDEAQADAFVSAVSGESAAIRFVPLPYSDPKKVQQTMGSELADVIPFEIGDTVFDHAIQKRNEDGSSVSLAAVVPKPEVEKILDRLKAVDVDPKFLAVDVLQLYNLYTHFLAQDGAKAETPSHAAADADTQIRPVPGGPPEGRLILDIGHERTLALAATAEGIAYLRVIRAGGAQITRAIADAWKIDLEAAEAQKHSDGFVASSRHPPPDEAAQKMSDAVVQGLAPLIRELRVSLQSIRSEKRVRVAQIDLLGGGSKLRYLANRLAEELNVPVAQGAAVEQIVETSQVDAARRPAFALALAYGLRAAGNEKVAPIELRSGDFQFAGQLQHVREHLPLFAASAVLLFILLIGNVWATYFNTNKRERAVDQQFCKITKEVIGREICEPKQALSVIQQPAGDLGSVKLPTRTALNVAAELSARIPEKLDVKIEEMDITPDRVRLTGETTTYDAVDQIVAEYAKDSCYKEIKKGKLDKKTGTDRVEFQLTIHLEGCS